MSRVPFLFFLLIFITFGCATTQPTLQGVTVAKLYGEKYGEAIFKISPYEFGEKRCLVKVSNGEQNVTCDSEYLVSCTIANEDGQPFCQLVTEVAAERVSIYPKERSR
jgi:hypothetical protein